MTQQQRGGGVTETRSEYTIELKPAQPCNEDEAVCGHCGYKFGKLATKYRQDGTWIVLYLYGTPPSPTWAYSADCPACGEEIRFYAYRKGKQAKFE